MKKVIVRRKNIDEGISDYLPSADSVYAFGRNAADTATFGGYKYARAGADYAAKNVASKLGYGKGTTYDKELKQEKQKLAKDDVKNPKASAAGDIAGYAALAAAPEIPAVGKTIGTAIGAGEKASKIPYYTGLVKRAIGLKENLAGAGASMDGMGAPFSAIGQEIESKRKNKPIPLGRTMGSYVDEENAVGSGAVAGLGVGPQGEPGRPPQLMPMARRGKKFMGVETFIVSSRVFNQLRDAKRKGKHWRKYLDEDDTFHHIRMEARKNKKGAIIIEDENTGALIFARYGKEI